MTKTRSSSSTRRVDVPSLLLLAIGVASGVFSYFLIVDKDFDPLIIVPSVVAFTVGVTHLTKKEVRR